MLIPILFIVVGALLYLLSARYPVQPTVGTGMRSPDRATRQSARLDYASAVLGIPREEFDTPKDRNSSHPER